MRWIELKSIPEIIAAELFVMEKGSGSLSNFEEDRMECVGIVPEIWYVFLEYVGIR